MTYRAKTKVLFYYPTDGEKLVYSGVLSRIHGNIATVEVTVKNYRFLLEIKKSNIIQRVED